MDMNNTYQLNLQQKPIRVEILTSPFSQPIFYDENYGVVHHFIGLSAEIIKILSAVMNFSVIYQEPEPIHGYALANGTFTGALGRLLNNQSDISLSLFFIRDYGTTDIEFTTPIFQEHLCVVVQKADKISEAVLPLLTFNVTLWVYLLLSFIGCSIFWITLRIINAKRAYVRPSDQLYTMDSFSDYVHIVVDTGILFLSSPLMKLPKIWSERIFIISICLMSMVCISYFESVLSTVFVNPLYQKDINSLGELENSKLPIEMNERIAVDPVFAENSSLMERIEIVNTNHPLSHIVDHGNLSMILKRTTINFDFSHWFRLKKLHKLPDCPRTYLTAFVLPKNSVYFQRINEILIRLVRGGFIQKWLGDTMFNATLENTRLHGSLDQRDYIVLKVEDFEFPLYILLGGFVLSFLLFIGELCASSAMLDLY